MFVPDDFSSLSYDLYMDPMSDTLYIFVGNDVKEPTNIVMQTRKPEDGYKIKYIRDPKEN